MRLVPYLTASLQYTYHFVRWGILGIALGVMAMNTPTALAASLYLSPETGVYEIGDEFAIDILIDTSGEAINAAEGTIDFNKEELEVTSLSEEGSIIELWTREPLFSNEEGTITFSGGSINNYNGDGGRIMTVTFRAKRNVTSRVIFSAGAAILAADGKGSNILGTLETGAYTLTEKEITPTIEYVAVSDAPPSLSLDSRTHPEETRWYSNPTVEFVWKLAPDVESVRTSFDNETSTIPKIFSNEPLTSKTYTEVEDGMWYFHIQTKNEAGWSDVSHFKVQVDTVPPGSLSVIEKERTDNSDPRVSFVVSAMDELSGIDKYEFAVDNNKPETWYDDGSGVYTPRNVPPGEHTLTVTVFDKAGNTHFERKDFTVIALEPPSIEPVPESAITGGTITVRGTTYPSSDVVVSLGKDGLEPTVFTVKSDINGDFVFTSPEFGEAGSYSLSFQVVDERGAKSLGTARAVVEVSEPKILFFGTTALSFLSVVVPLLGIFALLFIFGWLIWYKLRSYRSFVRRETQEAEEVVHKAFKQLRKDVLEQLKLLKRVEDSRDLTREEERIQKVLGDRLVELESAISEELEDLEQDGNVQHHDHPLLARAPSRAGFPDISARPLRKSKTMQLSIHNLDTNEILMPESDASAGAPEAYEEAPSATSAKHGMLRIAVQDVDTGIVYSKDTAAAPCEGNTDQGEQAPSRQAPVVSTYAPQSLTIEVVD